jgi:hypothetical protein
VDKGKLELIGNWSMISDSAKLSYFKKFQDLSKTESETTINMTMQSSDAIHRKKKMEEFDECWKSQANFHQSSSTYLNENVPIISLNF